MLSTLGKKAEAGVVREYRSRMSMEFDYETEARTMNLVSDYFMPGGGASGGASRVAVPRSKTELSTRRLLVMEYFEGRSMRDSLRAKVTSYQRYPAIIRFPLLLSLQRKTKRHLTSLLEAQAQQIFRLGTFNADPHPGNIFLLPGGSSRPLGLLDFGCSKTLSPTQRADLARLFVALDKRDEDGIVEAAVAMGMKTKNMNREVIINFATHFFDRDLAPMSPPQYLLELKAIDKITSLPKEFMLVARSSLLLRGLGAKLHAPVRMSSVWAKEARRYLRENEA